VSRYPKPAKRPAPVAPFSPHLRYGVPLAAHYLGQSEAQTWIDIREHRLGVIREGARTFVPGSEIVRRSMLPQRPASPAHSEPAAASAA